MYRLISLIFGCLLSLPAVIMVLLMLMIENEPLVKSDLDLSPVQIARGKQLLDELDPRHAQQGSIKTVKFSQRDLSLALGYLSQHYLHATSVLEVKQSQAIVKMTWPLPGNPLGRFINLQSVLQQTERLPAIERIVIGGLSIPGGVVNNLAADAPLDDAVKSYIRSWQQALQHVEFQDNRVALTYQWQPDLVGQFSSAWLSEQQRTNIERYQRQLTETIQESSGRLSLVDLMQPLFASANQQSSGLGAVEDNRAALLVLTFYVNQRTLDSLIPQAKQWPRAPWRSVQLQGREDLAKHYLVSACIAAFGDTPLANAVGLYKEVADSQGGSGFSFRDLAADHAGTRLGELAISNETKGQALQKRLATASESDIMPTSHHFEESMTEATFLKRYGGLQGEIYQNTVQEIDRLIANLVINRL